LFGGDQVASFKRFSSWKYDLEFRLVYRSELKQERVTGCVYNLWSWNHRIIEWLGLEGP